MIFAVAGDLRVRGDVFLQYKRAKVYSTKCSYPVCNGRVGLHIIPKQMKVEIIKKFKFYIPISCKACNIHSNIDSWFEADLNNGENRYTSEQITDMIELFHFELNKNSNVTGNIFEFPLIRIYK